MIRLDHTHVLATFHRYTSKYDSFTEGVDVNAACAALQVDAQLEQESFILL